MVILHKMPLYDTVGNDSLNIVLAFSRSKGRPNNDVTPNIGRAPPPLRRFEKSIGGPSYYKQYIAHIFWVKMRGGWGASFR